MSRTGNSGTISGAILSTDRKGSADSAYYFNGSSFINFDFDTSNDNTFTWVFWLKDESTSSVFQRWLTTTTGGGDTGQVIIRESDQGHVQTFAGTSSFINSTNTLFWKDGNWHWCALG